MGFPYEDLNALLIAQLQSSAAWFLATLAATLLYLGFRAWKLRLSSAATATLHPETSVASLLEEATLIKRGSKPANLRARESR